MQIPLWVVLDRTHAWPAYSVIYWKWVQGFKREFDILKSPYPHAHLNRYPDQAAALPTEMFEYAYQGDVPVHKVLKNFEGLSQHIPLRKSSALLTKEAARMSGGHQAFMPMDGVTPSGAQQMHQFQGMMQNMYRMFTQNPVTVYNHPHSAGVDSPGSERHSEGHNALVGHSGRHYARVHLGEEPQSLQLPAKAASSQSLPSLSDDGFSAFQFKPAPAKSSGSAYDEQDVGEAPKHDDGSASVLFEAATLAALESRTEKRKQMKKPAMFEDHKPPACGNESADDSQPMCIMDADDHGMHEPEMDDADFGMKAMKLKPAPTKSKLSVMKASGKTPLVVLKRPATQMLKRPAR